MAKQERVAAVTLDRFHVAGVGRGTVENFRGPLHAAHEFGQRRVFQVGKAGAVWTVRHEQIPQALGAGDGFQFLDDPGGLPAVAGVYLVGKPLLVRVDVLRKQFFFERRTKKLLQIRGL
jgi:hypothetical protein